MAWLKTIVPSIGLLIGIVFVAIGATMGTASALKLAFYTPVYTPCSSIAPIPDTRPITEPKTPEEYCKEQQRSERAYYVQAKKENIIDGGVFLVVGILFWTIFRKSRTIS